MYTPSGIGTSELGDIEVVPDGDDLHLFHLTLPNHDVIQHAVSRDGLSWQALPAALRTGDPGAVDDDQIWTMSVTPRPDGVGWVMLYTALSAAEQGRVQRVAIAESSDLVRWRKRPDLPAIAADPQWYEADPEVVGAVSWRDPKPVRLHHGYVATICAREASGPLPRRGCVGVLASDDLEHWETRPPLFAPHRYWDLECPQIVRLETPAGPRWALIASVMEDRSLRYWVADDVMGPYHVPPGGDILAPAGHYAARATRWQERDLLFAWHQPRLHQGWQSTSQTVDWVEARNPFGKFLAPPLEIAPRNDGSLGLRSFAGWQMYEGDAWQPVPLDGKLEGSSTMAWAFATPPAHNYQVRGELTLNGARGGLALRVANDESSGLFIELAPGSRTVTLQRWGTRTRDMDAGLGLTYDVLQQAQLHAPIQTGQPFAFTLLNVGAYVEVSVNDEVVLATMTGRPASGASGVWVEDGELRAENVMWVPMRQPAPVPATPAA